MVADAFLTAFCLANPWIDRTYVTRQMIDRQHALRERAVKLQRICVSMNEVDLVERLKK